MEENQDTSTPQVESNAQQSTQGEFPQPGGQPADGGNSDDTRTIVTVLLLIFFFPIGLVLMWVWTTWKTWAKWLITVIGCLPVIFLFLIFLSGILLTVNPQGAIKMAECTQACEDYVGEEKDMCVRTCAGDQYLEYLDEGHSENDMEVEGY